MTYINFTQFEIKILLIGGNVSKCFLFPYKKNISAMHFIFNLNSIIEYFNNLPTNSVLHRGITH